MKARTDGRLPCVCLLLVLPSGEGRRYCGASALALPRTCNNWYEARRRQSVPYPSPLRRTGKSAAPLEMARRTGGQSRHYCGHLGVCRDRGGWRCSCGLRPPDRAHCLRPQESPPPLGRLVARAPATRLTARALPRRKPPVARAREVRRHASRRSRAQSLEVSSVPAPQLSDPPTQRALLTVELREHRSHPLRPLPLSLRRAHRRHRPWNQPRIQRRLRRRPSVT